MHTSRDPAEVAALLTLTAGTLEKIAGEVHRLQSTEYGEVEEPFFEGKVPAALQPSEEPARAPPKRFLHSGPIRIEHEVRRPTKPGDAEGSPRAVFDRMKEDRHAFICRLG